MKHECSRFEYSRFFMQYLRIPLTLALLLSAACSSSGPTGGADGGVGADGGAAAQDGGAIADGGAQACTSSAQCDGGVCNTCTHTCELTAGSTCQQDINCNILEAYCDACTGRCKPVAALCGACSEDRQCGADNKCLAGDGGVRGCGLDCSVTGCPVGYLCTTESGGGKQCRPCAGVCKAAGACGRDIDCPYRSFCNVQPGTCPVCAAGCQDDVSCGNGLKCHDNGRCAGACPAAPCPAGYTCGGDGHCKLPGGCLANADCRDLPGAPNYCDTTRNRCAAGCDEDNDCLPVAATQGSLCDRVARRCVQRPCSGTYQCANQQFCNLTSGQCFNAQGTYCQTCTNDNECACATGATCPPGPNHCLEFQDADGGSVGKYCMLGGCTVQDGGSGESGCPQGYRCESLPNPSGSGNYNACMRFCWQGR